MTSFSDAGEGATIGFATARGRNWPTLRQFTVRNRVGQLAELREQQLVTPVNAHLSASS